MLAALRPRRLGDLHAEDVPSHAFLAVIAALILVASLPAAVAGSPLDAIVSASLAALIAAFTAAAILQRQGHARAAALTTGIALLAIQTLVALDYPTSPALTLLSPIAFLIVVPHLRGGALGVFAVASVVPTLGIALSQVRAPYPGGELIGYAAGAVGTVAATLLLFVLAWRSQRTAVIHSERYRDLVAELPIGIVRVGADGRIMQANAAFAGALGITREGAALGQEIQAFLVEDLFAALARATRTPSGLASAELEIRRLDGSTGWVRATGRRRTHLDGTWTLDAAVEDITAERVARIARSRLAAIVDSAGDGIIGMELDGTITSCNAVAATALGWAPDDVIGHSIYHLANGPEHAIADRLLANAREGRRTEPLELVRTMADGRDMVLSLAASPVRDADGTIDGLALIARDVTQLRRMELDQERLEAQLRQAQKMDAIGRLAGGVAHDFNNLLTAILGYGRMVAEQVTDQALEDQRHVLHAAERATELTSRLLAFARQGAPDPRPVDVDEVLREALAMVERLVPERIELEADFGAAALVVADPVDLEQLLLNLVVNAVDATPGTGRIVIRTSAVELTAAFVAGHVGARTGRHVCVEVADTGLGMDHATLTRIFEPFFTTKPAGEGTGLGLAMVYGVVQQAGGTVWPESAVGLGTTMTIYLPAVDGALEPETRQHHYVPAGSERVLVVEDDESVRELAARILRRAGYEVHVAESPEAALDAAASEAFDVLVTDVVMPRLSGPELLVRLGGDMAAVFLSGYAGTSATALELDRPGRAFVAKPFEPIDLARAIRDVIDDRAGADGPPLGGGQPREP